MVEKAKEGQDQGSGVGSEESANDGEGEVYDALAFETLEHAYWRRWGAKGAREWKWEWPGEAPVEVDDDDDDGDGGDGDGDGGDDRRASGGEQWHWRHANDLPTQMRTAMKIEVRTDTLEKQQQEAAAGDESREVEACYAVQGETSLMIPHPLLLPLRLTPDDPPCTGDFMAIEPSAMVSEHYIKIGHTEGETKPPGVVHRPSAEGQDSHMRAWREDNWEPTSSAAIAAARAADSEDTGDGSTGSATDAVDATGEPEDESIDVPSSPGLMALLEAVRGSALQTKNWTRQPPEPQSGRKELNRMLHRRIYSQISPVLFDAVIVFRRRRGLAPTRSEKRASAQGASAQCAECGFGFTEVCRGFVVAPQWHRRAANVVPMAMHELRRERSGEADRSAADKRSSVAQMDSDASGEGMYSYYCSKRRDYMPGCPPIRIAHYTSTSPVLIGILRSIGSPSSSAPNATRRLESLFDIISSDDTSRPKGKGKGKRCSYKNRGKRQGGDSGVAERLAAAPPLAAQVLEVATKAAAAVPVVDTEMEPVAAGPDKERRGMDVVVDGWVWVWSFRLWLHRLIHNSRGPPSPTPARKQLENGRSTPIGQLDVAWFGQHENLLARGDLRAAVAKGVACCSRPVSLVIDIVTLLLLAPEPTDTKSKSARLLSHFCVEVSTLQA
jgi:hypothetical protein